MQSFMLIRVDEQTFDNTSVRKAFQHARGFQSVRENTPGGTPIEADYVDQEDSTTVAMNSSGNSIFIRGRGKVSLRAAWVMRNCFNVPLRILDTLNSFDLRMSDFACFDDLESAIQATWSKSL